ncbi:MAG: BON domain-containing protein [Nitrospinaceae bacterium]|nr:MAG: BON domain-containing protein [Nitrospinaceae bacterium]
MIFFRFQLALLLGVSLALISGCTTVLQETAGRVLQDRSAEDQKVDAKIHGGIVEGITGKDKKLLLDLSADVWEQRVMITGVLDDPEVRREVLQLARQDDRIREMYEHIQIVSTEEKEARRQQREAAESGEGEEKSGAGQAVNDFWIETKIKAQLLATKNVTSVNYFSRSVRNQVYVIGKAASAEEKDRVLKIIRETKGVKGVTEHIQVAAGA